MFNLVELRNRLFMTASLDGQTPGKTGGEFDPGAEAELAEDV